MGYAQTVGSVEARPSEISIQLSNLSNQTEQIDVLLQKLRDKLSSVLCTLPSTDENNPPPPEPKLCGLATVLREIGRKSANSAIILDSLLNSVEL